MPHFSLPTVYTHVSLTLGSNAQLLYLRSSQTFGGWIGSIRSRTGCITASTASKYRCNWNEHKLQPITHSIYNTFRESNSCEQKMMKCVCSTCHRRPNNLRGSCAFTLSIFSHLYCCMLWCLSVTLCTVALRVGVEGWKLKVVPSYCQYSTYYSLLQTLLL